MALFTVLGAQGFIGTHLMRRLGAQGHEVFAPPREPAVPAGELGHVVYAIGLTADFLRRPFDTVEAHVTVLSRVLRAARFDSLVYLSSTRLYDSGGAIGREDDDLILNPGNDRHLYDFSKGLGETLCRVAGRGKARVARLSCVYSDDLATDTFLHRVVRDALSEASLTIDTGLDDARDYVHVDDVCAAIAAIAQGGKRPIYNVASGANVSNRELFDRLGRLTGCRIAAREPARPDGPAPAPEIDVGALREDFGLTPRPLGDALDAMIAANRPSDAMAVAAR